MIDELEEFNRFKHEYEADPIFAVYQLHKMIEYLAGRVYKMEESNKTQDSEQSYKLPGHDNVVDLLDGLGL